MENLKNRYFAMRHGESKANVAEIILSHLENGVHEDFTLTQKGEQQAADSANKAKADGLLDENTIIYSSPFSRCKKTAKIAKEVLGVKSEITFDERLRERNFGDLEKTHNSNYQKVWDDDVRNPEHKEKNVESEREVLRRMWSVVKDLEDTYGGQKILLVSHGDPLMILEADFQKASLNLHRELKNIQTAEIRELKTK